MIERSLRASGLCFGVAMAVLFGAASLADANTIEINGPPGSGLFGLSAIPLPNGNVVVTDPTFGDGLGAVYLYTLHGERISTLTGALKGDYISGRLYENSGVYVLANGNFLVLSTYWANGGLKEAGAVTFVDGTRGLNGVVSATNSLVGTTAYEHIAEPSRLRLLANGNFILSYAQWGGGRGAVVWGSGTTGLTGVISESNALVGTNTTDYVGRSITALPNGNYVVASPSWNGIGASTFGNGAHGIFGAVSAQNSLLGATGDSFSSESAIPLTNGNYVLMSPYWNNNAGAATLVDGNTGLVGTISADNSLVGEPAQTASGEYGSQVSRDGVVALSNGNYTVLSTQWNQARGAATWGDGRTCAKGHVSAANSLVGTSANDQVGLYTVPLVGGDYVILSPSMHGTGANGDIPAAGAATWGDGQSGTVGAVSAANSLMGAAANDGVGGGYSFALSNGNYVVGSPNWNGGLGAFTWVGVNSSRVGIVSASNSIIGTQSGTQSLGWSGTPLNNGNYVIGTNLPNLEFSQWLDGSIPTAGTITVATSLLATGAPPPQYSGWIDPTVSAMSNGNYAVNFPLWNNGAGAVMILPQSQATVGTVSAANALVGTSTNRIGDFYAYPNNTVEIWSANGSPQPSVTIVRGTDLSGITIDSSNTIFGSPAESAYQPLSDLLVVSDYTQNKVTLLQLDLLFRGKFE